jgi:hypothetical protein
MKVLSKEQQQVVQKEAIAARCQTHNLNSNSSNRRLLHFNMLTSIPT